MCGCGVGVRTCVACNRRSVLRLPSWIAIRHCVGRRRSIVFSWHVAKSLGAAFTIEDYFLRQVFLSFATNSPFEAVVRQQTYVS